MTQAANPITIKYEDYLVSPEGFSNSTAQLYLISESAFLSVYPLDYSKLISLPSWVGVNDIQKSIVIQPDTNVEAKDFAFVLIQLEANYAKAFTFQTFKVTVLSVPAPMISYPFLATVPSN